MENKMEVISIVVENNYGVLARISSLFGRRGFNIETITASNTADPMITKIIVTLKADPYVVEQVIGQTKKLEEVLEVKVLDHVRSVMREIALLKVKANASNRADVKGIADIYGASVVDLSPTSMIVELTGKPSKIDAFVHLMEEFEVVEMCRTGVTAMERKNS